MARSDDEGFPYGKLLWVFGAIMLFFFLNPIVIISAGERGVIMNFGAVQDEIMGEGLHFRMPFAQSVEVMDVKTQKYQAEAGSASKDLQDVKTQVALNYHLDVGQVNTIYQSIGRDFADRIISPAIQESVKASTADFTAEELITKRPVVKTKIDDALKARLAPYGIVVETISITDFQFSEQFTTAIEAKVVAEQSALQAQNKLKQVQTEAEMKVASATAEAKAIQIQGDALRNNPGVVSLRWIEKWNGVMPIVFGGGNGFILDISSMMGNATG